MLLLGSAPRSALLDAVQYGIRYDINRGLVLEGMISWKLDVIWDSGAIDKTAFRSAKMCAYGVWIRADGGQLCA